MEYKENNVCHYYLIYFRWRRQRCFRKVGSRYQGCWWLCPLRVWQGVLDRQTSRLLALLPNQLGYRHEGLSPCRPPRMDQGGCWQIEGPLRRTRCSTPWYPWWIWWPNWCDIRHFQQASFGILWSSIGSNYDWWCQYFVRWGFGFAKETWHEVNSC